MPPTLHNAANELTPKARCLYGAQSCARFGRLSYSGQKNIAHLCGRIGNREISRPFISWSVIMPMGHGSNMMNIDILVHIHASK